MIHISALAAVRAVGALHWPTSLAINVHLASERGSKPGHWPGSSAVLRALRRAEKQGWVKCVRGPLGYYGYEWALTDTGKELLQNAPGH